MKRTLMKFLPIAAAVLLATSCGKDDNSVAVVEEGTPIVEEVYDSNVKTITISGKVGQESLSKISVSGSTLKFESGDKFTFGTTGADNVYGTIEITATDGSYTATVNFPSESALLDPDGFLATKGTKPTGLSSGKDNLGQAVQYAYYEVPFKVTKNTSTGKYALATTVSGKSGDILVNLQSAFIYALSPGFIKLGGAEVGVNTNLYYVIPVGVTMGSGTKVAEAGKVYKYGNEKVLPGKFTVDANGKRVQFSRGVLDFDEANDMRPSDWWGLRSDQRYDGRDFGWGTWATGGLSPATTSTTNSDYTATLEGSELKSLKAAAESFIGEDWATLSRTQWNYLLNTRTTTSVRFAKVRVPDPYYYATYRYGLLLLPDDWNGSYSFTTANNASADFEILAASDWNTLESEGAVFLDYYTKDNTPGAGAGCYWTSTQASSTNAYALTITDSGVSVKSVEKQSKYSVRLVQFVGQKTITSKAGWVDKTLVEEDFE